MPRAHIMAVLVAVGLATVYVTPVRAQCDSTGHGAPGITNVAATSSSIKVSWLLQCSLVPARIELRQGGTSQQAWQNGTLLGTIDLAPLMNGGAVTVSQLPAVSTLPRSESADPVARTSPRAGMTAKTFRVNATSKPSKRP